MNRHRRMVCLATVMLAGTIATTGIAENGPEVAEQGLNEIQPLLEISEVDETEGMSLEEMTEAYFSSIEDKLTGILQADDPYAILTSAYALLQKHPYMKEPAELTAAMEIRRILNAVPETISTGPSFAS